MATDRQKTANRANAKRSTGPRSAPGKQASSRNAVRHGVFASVVGAEHGEVAQFEGLTQALAEDLRPVGVLEQALVEKVALAIWRNRRLVAAECATVALRRRPDRLARVAACELGLPRPFDFDADDLEPLEPHLRTHYENLLAEADLARRSELSALPTATPAVWAALEDEARNEEFCSVETYLQSAYGDNIAALVDELESWARAELLKAANRRRLLAMSETVGAAHGLPATDELELFARYQTILDGQLFKAMRALRDAQAARRAAVELEATAIDAEN